MRLPEVRMLEDGCDTFGQCTTCMLPVCWFEMSKPEKRQVMLAARAVELYKQGLSLTEIGEQLELSRRTTVRFLDSLRSQELIGRRRAKSR